MTATLTLAQLRNAVARLKQHALPAVTVVSEAEAQAMTRDDPAGHVWHVGEQYYLLPVDKCP